MGQVKIKLDTLKEIRNAYGKLSPQELHQALRNYSTKITARNGKWKENYRKELDKTIQEIAAGIQKK